jgi:hypothetical protein
MEFVAQKFHAVHKKAKGNLKEECQEKRKEKKNKAIEKKHFYICVLVLRTFPFLFHVFCFNYTCVNMYFFLGLPTPKHIRRFA